MVSSQVLGGSDFLSSRSTSDKTPSDNQLAGQYAPPAVQQQLQQYYQPAQQYQPAATEQQHQYPPEYYQQQQQQQYGQNFNSEKQVGIIDVFFYKNQSKLQLCQGRYHLLTKGKGIFKSLLSAGGGVWLFVFGFLRLINI